MWADTVMAYLADHNAGSPGGPGEVYVDHVLVESFVDTEAPFQSAELSLLFEIGWAVAQFRVRFQVPGTSPSEPEIREALETRYADDPILFSPWLSPNPWPEVARYRNACEDAFGGELEDEWCDTFLGGEPEGLVFRQWGPVLWEEPEYQQWGQLEALLAGAGPAESDCHVATIYGDYAY